MIDKLSINFGRRIRCVLQTESAECGLACLTMIAGFHGYRTDLATLRRDFPVSLKGATLSNLIQVGKSVGLSSRPLKADMNNLDNLKLPCILHWEFNHFVVLQAVTRRSATIYDPAFGIKTVALDVLSRSFTGVALELWPHEGFKVEEKRQVIKLRVLVGRVSGIASSMSQIISLALALEVFSVASPFFLQWVIDNAIVSADNHLLITLAIGFGLLMLMQQIFTAVRSWTIMAMAASLNVQWRANAFSHLVSLPVNYFEKRHLGDVVSRFGAIDHIQRTLTTSFMEAILDGLMTLVTLVMMYVYSPPLTLIVIVAMILYCIVRSLWYWPTKRASEEQLIHGAKQQSHLLETIRGVKAIKLFQRQETRRMTWLACFVDQVNADLKIQKLQIFYKLINGILFGIAGICTVWFGGKLVIDGEFTVGVLMAFISYKMLFESRVVGLIDKVLEISLLQVQSQRLADILLTEPESTLTDHHEGILDSLEPTIELKNLSFRYAAHESLVLDDISLKISAGESVAIIGPSGCGKSTLISVLLGILPPTSGEFFVAGINVKQCGIDVLRGMIGTVLQDDVLFAGSIADNISFFDPKPEMNFITECAHRSAVLTEIMAMPMGFNTLVGDMGTVLSGGQKQRVLLARALYKRPKILFMDEATSHLDVAKEREVNQAISMLKITRIIVAHRPETIASANRIISLLNGKITSVYREEAAHVKGVVV